ncbi:MAG: peptide ABC transporter substrate-binding protein [Woeseiaceae bacterium]|nr:peptide ABC transporter substrate-binding protein [Woeseiaceae bacterium]
MTRLRWLTITVFALLVSACADHDAGLSVLKRGLGTEPESLDPQMARSVQAADVLRDTGEGLVGYSADGRVVAAAAESWEISEDALEYTFTIRENARWSDGVPLTAEHFVHGMRRLVNPDIAAFYSQSVASIDNAACIIVRECDVDELGVEALDDKTVLIRLERPVPYLLSLLTHPSTFPVRADLEGQDRVTTPTVSNGAYAMARHDPGSVIRLIRNEYYWNNAATAIDVVDYYIVTEEALELNRYRAGDLHITSNVPPATFQSVRERFPDELKVASYLGVYYYGFNMTQPPFKDNPKLRQALSMAIDREVLVEKVTGRGEAPAYSFVPPGVNNYIPPKLSYADLSQEERNDIARSLYAEAGYGPDNPLTIELRYNTSDTQRRMALAIQAMWEEVLGVETVIVNEEFQVLLANIRKREETEVFRASWIGDYNDAQTFLDLMLTNSASNLPGYGNPAYDELMVKAAEQTDLDRRRLFLEEAERVMLADHPLIPIYFYVSKHLIKPEVKGWQDNILDYHYSQHLSLGEPD